MYLSSSNITRAPAAPAGGFQVNAPPGNASINAAYERAARFPDKFPHLPATHFVKELGIEVTKLLIGALHSAPDDAAAARNLRNNVSTLQTQLVNQTGRFASDAASVELRNLWIVVRQAMTSKFPELSTLPEVSALPPLPKPAPLTLVNSSPFVTTPLANAAMANPARPQQLFVPHTSTLPNMPAVGTTNTIQSVPNTVQTIHQLPTQPPSQGLNYELRHATTTLGGHPVVTRSVSLGGSQIPQMQRRAVFRHSNPLGAPPPGARVLTAPSVGQTVTMNRQLAPTTVTHTFGGPSGGVTTTTTNAQGITTTTTGASLSMNNHPFPINSLENTSENSNIIILSSLVCKDTMRSITNICHITTYI